MTTVLAAALAAGARPAQAHPKETGAGTSRLPLAVMGDSDSHAYHDRIWSPEGPGQPGGVWRAHTFQWTEVLHQLRGRQLDLGAWGVWGERRSWVWLKEHLGLEGRAPRKQDFEYNFALGGSRCAALTSGLYRQAPRLVTLMSRDAQRWRQGLVVVRIGIVDIGLDDSLDALARTPADARVHARIDTCLAHIRQAVTLIHARHPQTRVVLVGILDNTDYPPYEGRWPGAAAHAGIAAALDRFDAGLRAMASADASRVAFFDDRAWFAKRWGTPRQRRTVSPMPGLTVRHASGDSPDHSVLSDGHAGLVWNTLWAASLVDLLNARFQLGLTPIDDAEIAEYLARTTRRPHASPEGAASGSAERRR